jgi:membrane protease YdiL (CAAX protease family)
MSTASPTEPTSTDRPNTSVAWWLFLAVFALTVPFWVLGSLTDARLMPGLPLSALMFLCTATVAGAFAYRSSGPAGLRGLLGRVVDFRRTVPWTWHLVSLLLMPGVLLLEYVIMRAAHLPLPLPQVAWGQTPLLMALFFGAAACEELAWSATALEPLQRRYGALVAGLIIGVVWGVWHLIPFAQGNPSALWVLGQFLFTVAFRVVLVWLYNVAGRSLFTAVVCHAAYNVAWQLFPNQGSGYNPWITAGLTAAVALIVAIAFSLRTVGLRETS